MDLQLFDEVGEVLRGLLPPELGELRTKHHRYGIKVWFGPAKPTREHYEAQVIGAKHVAEADGAGHRGRLPRRAPRPGGQRAGARAPPRAARSGGARCSGPRRWPASSSTTATGGSACRRPGPTPTSAIPISPIELATRLTDYITTLEPLRAG